MSELTPGRLRELRRIAEAATPGPWISPWHLECENAEEYGFYAANGEKVVGLFWFDGYHLECSEENARHIVTFDPTTVLAMIAEIERLRRVLEQVEWEQSPANCPICDGYKSHGHAPDCELAAALSSAQANPYAAVVEAAIAARDAFRLYDNPEKWHKAIAKLARVVEDLDPKLVVALDREEGRE